MRLEKSVLRGKNLDIKGFKKSREGEKEEKCGLLLLSLL
jgi:hypothetical protein